MKKSEIEDLSIKLYTLKALRRLAFWTRNDELIIKVDKELEGIDETFRKFKSRTKQN